MRPVGSKYLLEETLGRGATGTVWRAQVRPDVSVPGIEPGRPVAIKILREELAADPDVVMRFLRERSVLLRLTHPNIVRVRDLVVEGELLALVMDLVEGPDLFRYLRSNGPFSPIAGALLMAQIADALAASHADGVVHRDLKPANVLLASTTVDGSEQMHPMLTDFGIARLADSPGITRTHEFVGTPAYVAPESADGRPQTSAVDVYGAGIMLYELVTGRPPFQGDSPIAILHAHIAQDPERPRTMPEPLWTVIERCLRKNPDERPSAVSLAGALRVVAAGVGVHASPAAVDAALAVGALLLPDPRPAGEPAVAAPGEAPQSWSDPTQVLPTTGYDPSAATRVFGGAEDRTQLLGSSQPAPDRTRMMPPVPAAPTAAAAAAAAEAPHPWQTQLRAARDRNQQTEVGYLDPQQFDGPGAPQVAPRPYQPYQQQPPQPYQSHQQRPQQPPYGRQPQQGREQGQQQGYEAYRPPAPQPAPARRQEPPTPRQREREPEPVREREREREPRRRSRNRMYIPGLGCLKGCLMVLLILAVAAIALWNFTPLPQYWHHVQSWVTTATDWAHRVTGK